MKITDTIKYVGVNDHKVDLFEGQYPVANGMAYNSYVILDEKIAVMDTVDANFTHEWLDNLEQVLDGRKPDYLIVQHRCRQRENLPDDLQLFRTYSGGTEARSYQRRHVKSWKPSADFCICSDGTLAGSYGNLRQH